MNTKLCIKPPALRQGDTISVVAPASPIKEELLQEGCRELERLGYRPRYRPDITDSKRYFAGRASRRRLELIDALADPDVRAVFCARGGYGSGHLISALKTINFVENPKIVLGSSDLTMLLNFIAQSGCVAFHGPMVATSIRQGEAGYDRRLFVDILEKALIARFPTDGCTVIHAGEGIGRLAGGCLSMVVATLGTPYEIYTRGAILLLEDIDTKPYQIDRMMTQLKHAGKFEGVRGVVLGEMLNCTQHPNQGYTLHEVLTDVFEGFPFPVLSGFPTGHTSRPHVLVPLGVRARLALKTAGEPVFEMLEPAVTLDSRQPMANP